MRTLRFPALATVAAAMAFSLAPVSIAAADSAGTRLAQQQASYSDTELKQFAVAALEVQRISDEYRSQLKGASSTEQQQEIQTEAQTEMVAAVNDAGLSVKTYNQIQKAAQTDPAISQKITGFIRDAQKE